MSINHSDPRPPYQQVADHLRRAIDRGEYGPGERLPSMRTLSEQFSVTPVTISRAVDALRAEGLVDARQGTGLFVRPRRPVMRVASYLTAGADGSRTTWSDEVDRQGYKTTQEITEIGTVPAPADVAERLNLEPGTPAIVRRRVLRVDDTPVQLSDSYYPASLAEGTELSRPEKLRGYTMEALERLGIQLSRFQDDIYLRMPTPSEAAKLQLGRGVPVLKLLRTTYSTDNQPVEVADQILAGDRYVLSYEVPAHPLAERNQGDAR